MEPESVPANGLRKTASTSDAVERHCAGVSPAFRGTERGAIDLGGEQMLGVTTPERPVVWPVGKRPPPLLTNDSKA